MPLNQSCRLQEFQRKRMKKIQSNDSDVNWCGTRVSEVSLLLWPFSTELLTSWNPSTQRSHNGGRSSGLCSDAAMSCLSILFCLMCKSDSFGPEGLHIAASSTAIYAVLATSHLQYESVHKLTSRISHGQKTNENLRHQHLSWQWDLHTASATFRTFALPFTNFVLQKSTFYELLLRNGWLVKGHCLSQVSFQLLDALIFALNFLITLGHFHLRHKSKSSKVPKFQLQNVLYILWEFMRSLWLSDSKILGMAFSPLFCATSLWYITSATSSPVCLSLLLAMVSLVHLISLAHLVVPWRARSLNATLAISGTRCSQLF